MSKLEELIKELCPNGVEFKPLGNIVKFINGRAYKQSELLDIGKYPVLRVGNFYTNDKWYYSDLELNEDKYCQNGDLLYTWAATLGPQIWVGEKVIFHYHIWKLSFDEDILDKRFLYYFLAKDVDDISKSLTQSTMPHVSMTSMNKRLVPLPPLPVQREIVRILDNFTELTAELTAELTVRKKQYEYYRDELLTFGDDVPVVKLGNIATVTKLAGFEFTKYVTYSDKGNIIALRGLNVKNGKLNLDDVKYIDKSDLSKLTRSKLVIGDMLFTYVGTVGQVALIDENDRFYLAPNVALIRITNDNVMPEFMRYYFQTNTFWNTQIKRLLQSSSMKNIPMEKIRKFELPVPPLEEQQRIVAILDRFDALCNDLTNGLPAEIEARQKQYEYYRDKLLDFKEII